MVQQAVENRREYFRLSFGDLPAAMQIIEVGQRPITTTQRTVHILNLGGGGLYLLGEEDLPIRRGVVAQFQFTLGQHSFSFRGVLVRKVDDRATYQYGVRFIDVDEYQRGLLVSTLGRIQVDRNFRTGG